MIYSSDRKYGCRYKEVIYHSLRTIILENEKISTIILVDKGTDIISINYKPKDMEFIWTDPIGLSNLEKRKFMQYDDNFIVDAYFGGWFECFPNTGGHNYFHNKHFMHNAEITYLPWDVTVIEDTPQKVTLKFTVICSKTPFKVEKTITIKSGIPSLFIEETATNLSCNAHPYLWGHHPIAGGQFVDEYTKIDLPDATIASMLLEEDEKATSKWPNLDIADKQIDCSVFPQKGSMTFIHMKDLEGNWGAIRNEKTGLGIGYSWDKNMFNYAILWVANGDNTSPSNFGGQNLACIFPKSSSGGSSLDVAEENGELLYLEGNSCVSTWFTVSVFEGNSAVKRIDRDGSVLF